MSFLKGFRITLKPSLRGHSSFLENARDTLKEDEKLISITIGMLF